MLRAGFLPLRQVSPVRTCEGARPPVSRREMRSAGGAPAHGPSRCRALPPLLTGSHRPRRGVLPRIRDPLALPSLSRRRPSSPSPPDRGQPPPVAPTQRSTASRSKDTERAPGALCAGGSPDNGAAQILEPFNIESSLYHMSLQLSRTARPSPTSLFTAPSPRRSRPAAPSQRPPPPS